MSPWSHGWHGSVFNVAMVSWLTLFLWKWFLHFMLGLQCRHGLIADIVVCSAFTHKMFLHFRELLQNVLHKMFLHFMLGLQCRNGLIADYIGRSSHVNQTLTKHKPLSADVHPILWQTWHHYSSRWKPFLSHCYIGRWSYFIQMPQMGFKHFIEHGHRMWHRL